MSFQNPDALPEVTIERTDDEIIFSFRLPRSGEESVDQLVAARTCETLQAHRQHLGPLLTLIRRVVSAREECEARDPVA